MRTGTANLPLHGGRVPLWLAARMARLGRVIVEALVLEYGRGEVLRRLADPFWFQALGSVMGMDWHSSGITTSVLGALKRGLAPVEHELGMQICDETLRVLRQAVDRAKLGQADKLAGLARLDEQCRLAEAAARGKAWPASGRPSLYQPCPRAI